MAANSLWRAIDLLHELPRVLAPRFGEATLPRGADGNLGRASAANPELPAEPADAPPPEAARSESTRGSTETRPARGLEEHSEQAIPIHVPPEWLSPKLEYEGSRCEGVFVYLVTVFEGSPRDSAVTFATSAEQSASFARPGQKVGPWEVLAITEDWTGMMPVVWLVQDRKVCRTGLTGNPARVLAIQAREAQASREAAERRRQRAKRRRRRR